MTKPISRWRKPESGQQYTINNPLKEPFEGPFEIPLKSSGVAGLSYENNAIPESLEDWLMHDSSTGYAAHGIRQGELGKLALFHKGEIISQRDGETLHDFIRLLTQQYDSVVTLDDIANQTADGIVVNTFPRDYSLADVITKVTAKGRIFESAGIDENKGAWQLTRVVKDFVEGYDCEVMRRLVELHDADQTLAVLADPFLKYFAKRSDSVAKFTSDQITEEDLFFAGLELIANGVQSAHDLVPVHNSSSGFGARQIESVCEAVLETVARSERGRFELMKKVAVERYGVHSDQFNSSTTDEENDSDLPAAVKASIFVRAVREMQNAGMLVMIPAIDTSGKIVAVVSRYEKPIVLTKADQQRAKDYFDQHKGSCAWSLLSLLKACIRVYTENNYTGHGFAEKGFYAEKALMITFFFKHLKTIATELKNRYAIDYPRRIGMG
jgi:hypothetical protein